MLHDDAVLEGFTETDWSRMLALFSPAGDVAKPERAPEQPFSSSNGALLHSEASPSPNLLEDLLDLACPDGRAMVIGVFDRGELWTSVALSRREGAIEKIVGSAALRDSMGLLSGDWRRDYRHLARAAEDRLGWLASGYFSDLGTLRALVSSTSPGAWARAVAVRDIIISPFPVAIALPLGMDAARAGLSIAHQLAERFEPLDKLRRLLTR